MEPVVKGLPFFLCIGGQEVDLLYGQGQVVDLGCLFKKFTGDEGVGHGPADAYTPMIGDKHCAPVFQRRDYLVCLFTAAGRGMLGQSYFPAEEDHLVIKDSRYLHAGYRDGAGED